MDQIAGGQVMIGLVAGISSFGFYMFLAAWVATSIWARTKEKVAVQETLRKLIESGTSLTPEVIDALRQAKPRQSPTEIVASAKKYFYWGSFLVVLGVVITLWGLAFSDSQVQDLREMPMAGVVLFVIPGLFCLAHSAITRMTRQG